METIRAFISSTVEDLKDYRTAAIDVCNNLGIIPVAMEYFESMETGATKGSIEKLKNCNVFISIVAYRYGYIQNGFPKSVTEIEYDTAGEEGIDRLCFVLADKHPWPPKFIDYSNEKPLRDFKDKISRNHIRKEITTIEDFRAKLSMTLNKWKGKNIESRIEELQDKLADAKENLDVNANANVKEIKKRIRLDKLLSGLNRATISIGSSLTKDKIFESISKELNILGISCILLTIDKDKSKLFAKYLSYDSDKLITAKKFIDIKHDDFSIPIDSVEVYREVVKEKKLSWLKIQKKYYVKRYLK